jgi:hypothetical protein
MSKKKDDYDRGFWKFYDSFFGTEIWSQVFVMLTQDIPFFVIRLIILVNFESTTRNYTFYFFIIKNFFLVIFELYRILELFVIEYKNI